MSSKRVSSNPSVLPWQELENAWNQALSEQCSSVSNLQKRRLQSAGQSFIKNLKTSVMNQQKHDEIEVIEKEDEQLKETITRLESQLRDLSAKILKQRDQVPLIVERHEKERLQQQEQKQRHLVVVDGAPQKEIELEQECSENSLESSEKKSSEEETKNVSLILPSTIEKLLNHLETNLLQIADECVEYSQLVESTLNKTNSITEIIELQTRAPLSSVEMALSEIVDPISSSSLPSSATAMEPSDQEQMDINNSKIRTINHSTRSSASTQLSLVSDDVNNKTPSSSSSNTSKKRKATTATITPMRESSNRSTRKKLLQTLRV